MRQLSDSHKVFFIDATKSLPKALKKAAKAAKQLEEEHHTILNVIPELYFEGDFAGWTVTIVAL